MTDIWISFQFSRSIFHSNHISHMDNHILIHSSQRIHIRSSILGNLNSMAFWNVCLRVVMELLNDVDFYNSIVFLICAFFKKKLFYLYHFHFRISRNNINLYHLFYEISIHFNLTYHFLIKNYVILFLVVVYLTTKLINFIFYEWILTYHHLLFLKSYIRIDQSWIL